MQVDDFLKEHEVYDFTLADFEQDRETLRQAPGRRGPALSPLPVVVVTDTSPINYLVLIGQVDLLKHLYTRILIPPGNNRTNKEREY